MFATVEPLDAGGGHTLSLSMQSLAPHEKSLNTPAKADCDDDECDPNDCGVAVISSCLPEAATDVEQTVRRLAMDAVWCTQLHIDPQNDLRTQTWDEKVRARWHCAHYRQTASSEFYFLCLAKLKYRNEVSW